MKKALLLISSIIILLPNIICAKSRENQLVQDYSDYESVEKIIEEYCGSTPAFNIIGDKLLYGVSNESTYRVYFLNLMVTLFF